MGDAKQKLTSDPRHTVASPKRLLGRKFRDREVEPYLGQAAFETAEAPDGTVLVSMRESQYAITQLCAYVLQNVRELAERTLGTEVRHAVATVPASYDADRLAALRRAGEMAQLEFVSFIDEPSAAALANRYTKGFGGVVGIYDFGGGTFDFSVVDVTKGDFEVLATSGDSWLGGDDFDQALAGAVADQLWKSHKFDVRKQAAEWQRLLWACESAKRDLSTKTTGHLFVKEMLRTAAGTEDLDVHLNRSAFEKNSGGR